MGPQHGKGHGVTPQRSLGLTSTTALVVASMIGAGVFTMSGFLLADLGSPWYVLAAWAVGGVQAALGAMCYGALAQRIPEAGGEYLFLSRTLHPAAGYVAGWLSLLVGVSSLLMEGPRVYAQKALDGVLPRWPAAATGPPRAAIVLQAGLALLLLWSATLDALLTWIGFTLSISTAATTAALIVLRKREGKTLAVPGYPVVPWLFLTGVSAMTAFTVVRRPMESLVGLGTILAGLAAWRLQKEK
jgi:amino acid transporter